MVIPGINVNFTTRDVYGLMCTLSRPLNVLTGPRECMANVFNVHYDMPAPIDLIEIPAGECVMLLEADLSGNLGYPYMLTLMHDSQVCYILTSDVYWIDGLRRLEA